MSAIATAAAAATIGLAVGSFVGMLVHRLPRRLPFTADRSRCPACGHALGAGELVPVVSWLVQRGRCAHCGVRIPWRYPLVESVTAMLFVAAVLRFGLTPEAALVCLLAATMVAVTVIDLEWGIIPDALTVPCCALGLAFGWLQDDPLGSLGGAALGAALGAGLLLGYRRLRGRDGLGWGDVKFFALAGSWVGALDLFLFFLLAGLIGIAAGLVMRHRSPDGSFPFGPGLAAALLLLVLVPEIGGILRP